MELFISIFLTLISLIICLILVLLNEVKYYYKKQDREVENERDNNKSFKS